MRRPPQLGQKPRPLHEKGTSRSKAQSPQRSVTPRADVRGGGGGGGGGKGGLFLTGGPRGTAFKELIDKKAASTPTGGIAWEKTPPRLRGGRTWGKPNPVSGKSSTPPP